MILADNLNSYLSIDNLVKDAKMALKSGALFSALALTFSLVAECAYIKYPDKWFEENADTDVYMKKLFPYNFSGKGKYVGKNHDKERFIMWYEDWYNAHNCKESERKAKEELEQILQEHIELGSVPTPHMNGELLYQLRCTLFHEASSQIDFSIKKKISDKGNSRIASNGFILTLEKNKPNENYGLACGVAGEDAPSIMNISVNGLVCHLLNFVERDYKNVGIGKYNKVLVDDQR